MYFSTDLDNWTEVPIEFEGWISTVAVGSNAVVLAGEEGIADAYPVLEGDEDFIYTPPSPVLWVGRP